MLKAACFKKPIDCNHTQHQKGKTQQLSTIIFHTSPHMLFDPMVLRLQMHTERRLSSGRCAILFSCCFIIFHKPVNCSLNCLFNGGKLEIRIKPKQLLIACSFLELTISFGCIKLCTWNNMKQ